MGGACSRQIKSTPPTISVMHSLPRPGHPRNGLINHWGVGLFKVQLDSGCYERLIGCQEYFNSYKESGFHDLLHFHMPLLGYIPSLFLKGFFNTDFNTSMGFTSLNGYEGEGFLGGVAVVNMAKVFGFQWTQTGTFLYCCHGNYFYYFGCHGLYFYTVAMETTFIILVAMDYTFILYIYFILLPWLYY